MDINSKICLSIGHGEFDEIKDLIEREVFAEIRLDMLNLSQEEIKSLFLTNNKLIATHRGNHNDSVKQMLTAASAGAEYIDIDISLTKSHRDDLLKIANDYKCKLIISYHNYEETPKLSDLKSTVDFCLSLNPDITKIICTAKSYNDNATIMSLYSSYKNIMAFNMGDIGRITRVSSIFCGAPFTFVAMENGKGTANGQMTATEMKILLKQFC